MSISHEIAPHLPYLRRFARALCGRQESGDAYVVALLESLVAHPSLFPRGIPIGRVTRVDTRERELYQRVHLRPFADLRRLNVVEVLVPGPGGGGQRAEVIP